MTMEQVSDARTTVSLTIDGKSVTVSKGTTVYQAAKQMGIEIPIFCYLDRLPPFGACRMCLVEVEHFSRLQTACTLEVTEGMVVRTQATAAVEGRKEILEFLLINHPLDCPICDRGGECPLQDNTWNHGPGSSRFFEEKRHFKKPLPLGPLLMLDRERCISCARCTRFSDLLAGDHALEFKERGYRTEIGTPQDAPAESKFIGNTVMICPVGALTSRTYRFRARPWDNASTESICTLCPVGCNLTLDARDGQIVRVRSRENRDVNDIWLCDKGWYGYEFSQDPRRLREPLIRRNGKLEPASWAEAFEFVTAQIQAAKPKGKLAAFGGDSLTCEENYLLQRLMREGAGVDHLDHRIGMPLFTPQEEAIPPGMESAIGECEQLSFAVLLGLDLTEEFPVIWLRLRQAVNKGAKLLYFGHFAPEIAPYCSQIFLHPPGEEIGALKQHLPQVNAWLENGKKGALFVGRQYLANPQRRAILAELWQLKQVTPHLALHIMEGRGNSMGARLAGVHPHYGVWGERLEKPGWDAAQVLAHASSEGWDFLYVVGSNPARQCSASIWQEARRRLQCLVVQDLFLTATAMEADVVLPSFSFLEKEGSVMNIEGRIQRLSPGQPAPENRLSDGAIFIEIGHRLGLTLRVEADFAEKLSLGLFRLPRPEKLEGMAAPSPKTDKRLLATFARILFDRGERMQRNSHLIRLVQEPLLRLAPQEGEARGIRDGEEVEVQAQGKSLLAKVRWDKRVAPHTIVFPLGFEETLPLAELSANLENGVEVKIAHK